MSITSFIFFTMMAIVSLVFPILYFMTAIVPVISGLVYRLRLSDVWIFRERFARTKDEDIRFSQNRSGIANRSGFPSDSYRIFSPYIRKPNVVCSPFVLVCRTECMCPTKQGVSRKRWNKAGSFVPVAIGIGFCVGFVCIVPQKSGMPDLVRWPFGSVHLIV
jgi:hypothetical protein